MALVHHVRKNGAQHPGQTLPGSGGLLGLGRFRPLPGAHPLRRPAAHRRAPRRARPRLPSPSSWLHLITPQTPPSAALTCRCSQLKPARAAAAGRSRPRPPAPRSTHHPSLPARRLCASATRPSATPCAPSKPQAVCHAPLTAGGCPPQPSRFPISRSLTVGNRKHPPPPARSPSGNSPRPRVASAHATSPSLSPRRQYPRNSEPPAGETFRKLHDEPMRDPAPGRGPARVGLDQRRAGPGRSRPSDSGGQR